MNLDSPSLSTPKLFPKWILRFAVLSLLCLSFLNALYCLVSYEFGWGPKTYLVGPEDRFADLIKLSLSFRATTEGADKLPEFRNWAPIYQRYYEQPDYAGVAGLNTGKLTHFHHPPLSTLLFLLCGLFILKTGQPALALFLFFGVYLLEVCAIVWIGIPRAIRSREVTLAIFFFCLISYPALLTFSRANYVNAGLTTLPVVLFLVATFTSAKPSLLPLFALALAVNIHPNAILLLLALPIAFGVRAAIKPILQFGGIAAAICAPSYLAAHYLYPAYTIATFRQGLSAYAKIYIDGGAGVRSGSSLFGLVFGLHHALARYHVVSRYTSSSTDLRVFYVLAMLVVALSGAAYLIALRQARHLQLQPQRGGRSVSASTPESAADFEPRNGPSLVAPFLLVSSYTLLSPVFADYHLLVFLAPLLLACIAAPGQSGRRLQLTSLIAFASVFMLSPKNYGYIQLALNPLILCGVTLWLSFALIAESRRKVSRSAALIAADG